MERRQSDIATECGPRTEKFFYPLAELQPAGTDGLGHIYLSHSVRPNRYRLPNGELTPAQERGKAIFERSNYKNGTPIPDEPVLPTCHSGPKYTNQNHST